MIPLVASKHESIVELCRRHSVRRLDLFGSARREHDFDEGDSDIDLLVEFLPLAPGTRADSYFGLLEDLRLVFERPVDLVMSTAPKNEYFRRAVHADRELLYAA